MDENNEFSGVFMFTNPTDKARTFLWNNQEYTFAPMSTTPLIIRNETLENIQEIRKRFAKSLALERLYEGEKIYARGSKTVVFEYNKAKEMGKGLPPTFNEKILEPLIEECLKPLPVKRATIKEGKKLDDETNYKSTKAVGTNDDLNAVFREDTANTRPVGVMPDR